MTTYEFVRFIKCTPSMKRFGDSEYGRPSWKCEVQDASGDAIGVIEAEGMLFTVSAAFLKSESGGFRMGLIKGADCWADVDEGIEVIRCQGY